MFPIKGRLHFGEREYTPTDLPREKEFSLFCFVFFNKWLSPCIMCSLGQNCFELLPHFPFTWELCSKNQLCINVTFLQNLSTPCVSLRSSSCFFWQKECFTSVNIAKPITAWNRELDWGHPCASATTLSPNLQAQNNYDWQGYKRQRGF